MSKVTKEQATAEVESWLEHKKVSQHKREEQKGMIERLIGAVMDGDLVLDGDTKEFKQLLKFPLEGATPITELVYKPRLADKEAQMHIGKIPFSDIDARLNGYVAALTKQNSGIIKNLDREDIGLAHAIAVFFL